MLSSLTGDVGSASQEIKVAVKKADGKATDTSIEHYADPIIVLAQKCARTMPPATALEYVFIFRARFWFAVPLYLQFSSLGRLSSIHGFADMIFVA